MRAVVVTTLAILMLLLCGVPMFMHPPTAYTGVTYRELDPDEVDTLKRFCDGAAQAYISITHERFSAVPQAALA